MQHVAEQLQKTLTDYLPRFRAISESDWAHKPAPEKWSKKEILGHLVDSSFNNIQRFIRVQHEETPHVVYHQDDWVRIANYQQYPTDELITLWEALNKHICHILATADMAHANKPINTGKKGPELHSFKWIAEDYVTHMTGHLKQITDSENAAH